MDLTKTLSLLICLGLVSPSTIAVWNYQSRAMVKPMETIDFCNLVSDPEKYLDKTLRTQAVYSKNFEGQALSKSECPSGKNIRETVWGRIAAAEIDFDCRKLSPQQCGKLKKKLSKDLTGDPIDGLSAKVPIVGWIEILSPARTQAGFNEPAIRFHITDVENVNSNGTP